MKKIAVIVYGNGLEYDDRVRKESLALSKQFYVKIFILLESNKKEKGKTSYGIDYESIQLKTRTIFSRKNFLILKVFEFYLRLAPQLRKFDYVWANGESAFIFPLLSSKKKTIWDLHETMEGWNKGWRKLAYRISEKKAILILHANPQRIRYNIENGMIGIPDKQHVIHNFPDENFVTSTILPDYYETFCKWLNGEEYVYLQGLQNHSRFPYNSISSVLDETKYKIVVVGSVDKTELDCLKQKYPNFNQRVFLAGMTPQLAIPSLLKSAVFAIVLYTISTPNNRFCEPNRMFQAISLGVPVIVGCNESMKEVVGDEYGVSLNSDGHDIDDLKKGIHLLMDNYSKLKNNCVKDSSRYIWSNDMVKNEWFNV